MSLRAFLKDPLITLANHRFGVIGVYIGTLFAGGFIFGKIEDVNYLDGLYWASTTMSTTGYGDISPATQLGKVFAILFQAWSVVYVLAVVIAYVLDKFIHKPNEFTDDEQQVVIKAARLVIAEYEAAKKKPEYMIKA